MSLKPATNRLTSAFSTVAIPPFQVDLVQKPAGVVGQEMALDYIPEVFPAVAFPPLPRVDLVAFPAEPTLHTLHDRRLRHLSAVPTSTHDGLPPDEPLPPPSGIV